MNRLGKPLSRLLCWQAEVAKEYLRNSFHSGALDVTGSIEAVRGMSRSLLGY
jgi:hypothetical protein